MICAILSMITSGRTACAEELPALTSLSNAHLEFTVPEKDYVIVRRGDIEAVIVNNAAVDDDVLQEHRAGYSGLAKLTPPPSTWHRMARRPGVIGQHIGQRGHIFHVTAAGGV